MRFNRNIKGARILQEGWIFEKKAIRYNVLGKAENRKLMFCCLQIILYVKPQNCILSTFIECMCNVCAILIILRTNKWTTTSISHMYINAVHSPRVPLDCRHCLVHNPLKVFRLLHPDRTVHHVLLNVRLGGRPMF